MGREVLDRTSQTFGRLLVLREAGRDPQGRALWLCRCDCGIEKVIPSRHLGSGAVTSCGCYAKEVAAENGRRGAAKITGESSPRRKLIVGYHAMHQRVRVLRGPAQLHRCECGKQAQHWSYDLTDPQQLTGPGNLKYSLDENRYVPRCVVCHSAHDRGVL